MPWLDESEPYDYDILRQTANQRYEKSWHYNQGAAPFSTSDVIQGSNGNSGSTIGRLATTYSYHDNKPIQRTDFSYNDDGYVIKEDITIADADLPPLHYQIDYTDQLYDGTARNVKVTVDGYGEYSYRYVYDGLGRIREGYVQNGPDGTEQQTVAYTYDGTTGLESNATYYTDDQELFGVTKTYDIANRLSTITSPIFTESLEYEGPDGEGYYNGNISSVTSRYTNVPEQPGILSLASPSSYTYNYDGLNRLVSAAITFDGSLYPAGTPSPGGDASRFGSTSYEYDRVGRFTSLTRGIHNSQSNIIGDLTQDYAYPPSRNQLSELTVTDPTQPGQTQPAVHAFDYDDIGNLTQDGYDDNTLTYTRSTYTATVNDEAYRYDVNDQRILKVGGGKTETYLRNGSGQTLAVVDVNVGRATWYLYGNVRFGEFSSNRQTCGVACRPLPPDSLHTGLDADRVLRANRAWMDPDALAFPLNLYHVQLPSDRDYLVMPSDLRGLRGHYHVIGQESVTAADQTLTLWNEHSGSDTTLRFQEWLTHRLADDAPELLPSAPDEACAGDCVTDTLSCDPGVLQTQMTVLDSLSVLPRVYLRRDSFVELLRVRLCDGHESYIYRAHLGELSVGPVAVLQELSLNVSEGFSLRYQNDMTDRSEATGSILTVDRLLYRTGDGLKLDDYQSCQGTDNTPVASDSDLRFMVLDHLGSTRAVVGAGPSGEPAVVAAYEYYPYGKVLRSYEPCEPTRYLTTQHERDQGSGYDNRGARLYSSEIGVFLGVDPLAHEFTAFSSYNYVLGNPISLFDPKGTNPESYTVYVDGQKVSGEEANIWMGKAADFVEQEIWDWKPMTKSDLMGLSGNLRKQIKKKYPNLNYKARNNLLLQIMGRRFEATVLSNIMKDKNTATYNGRIPDAVIELGFIEIKSTVEIGFSGQVDDYLTYLGSNQKKLDGKPQILHIIHLSDSDVDWDRIEASAAPKGVGLFQSIVEFNRSTSRLRVARINKRIHPQYNAWKYYYIYNNLAGRLSWGEELHKTN